METIKKLKYPITIWDPEELRGLVALVMKLDEVPTTEEVNQEKQEPSKC